MGGKHETLQQLTSLKALQQQRRRITSVDMRTPSCHRGASAVPHLHSSQRISQGHCWIHLVFVSQFLSDHFPIYDLVLAGLVEVRVASFLGIPHLPKRLGPAAAAAANP